MADPPPEDQAPLGEGRFKIIWRLGAGGMGVVYEAYDHERKARVALKTLKLASPEALLLFKREFRSLLGVSHPNLVSLYELIQQGERWFFTMELVDGVDFISFIRATPRPTPPGTSVEAPPEVPALFDAARLRDALAQLAQGLVALHAAGKVHRDIKPANVLVTREGRVVLLDFGLVRDWLTCPDESSNHLVGTVPYMAPEQAASSSVGPAADWYSVGVLLYEALTGQRPLSGSMLAVLQGKQTMTVTPPAQHNPAVPADLDALCVALLAPDPALRPGGAEILRQLGSRPLSDPMLPLLSRPLLVGRDPELARLRGILAKPATSAETVIVSGESGVGKSFLIESFVAGLEDSNPGVLVLSGRCYERESVSFKAFDGIIDQLTRALARRSDVAALLPLRAAVLAQLFPVLRRIDAVLRAPTPREALDPWQIRARAFAALRELFTRLTERHRLVLVIDDLQWTDADSLSLLREVLRPPDAPPLLLIASVRDSDAAAVGQPDIREALRVAGRSHDIRLDPLSTLDAEALVSQLAERSGALSGEQIRAIATETGGHPLLIQELVQHTLAPGSGEPRVLRVGEAILARADQLDEATRRVVELVAVAGRPLRQSVIATAAQLSSDEFAARVARLRSTNLVRSNGARGHHTIENYHDMVREALLGAIPTTRRRLLHERLALAVEDSDHRDAETLAIHWRGAGQPARALHYVIQAAEEATAAVAFRRAARLYRLALELGAGERDERWLLTAKLADALANAGQGAESAQAFLEAARVAPADEQIELERRAAEQLLRTGYIDQGIKQIGVVLARLGMNLPRSPQSAFLSVLFQRAAVRLRGLSFHKRDVTTIAPRALVQLDTCWSATPLGLVDTIRGADFGARHLRLALELGEPLRVSRALAIEAVYAAQMDSSPRRARRLLAVAERLARGTTASSPPSRGAAVREGAISPVWLMGHLAGTTGLVEFVQGHFSVSRMYLERAERIFANECIGVTWELGVVRLFSLIDLLYEGKLIELGARFGPIVAEAEDHGDIFTATSARVAVQHVLLLADDRSDAARKHVGDAMRSWSQGGFQMQHRYALLTQVDVDLYEGRTDTAHQRLDSRWAEIERSLLLRIKQQRIETYFARARAAVAAAKGSAGRAPLYSLAEHHARLIERDRVAWAQPLALLIRAAVLAGRGDAEDAVDQLSEATRRFEEVGMTLHAAAARQRHGELIGGEQGRALQAAASSWFTSAGVRSPAAMTAMLAPGF